MASLRRAASVALPELENMMNTRYNRGNLEKGVAYIQVNKNGRTKVGKFVETAHYGSGDGMQIVLIFEYLGRRNVIQEEMWGSLDGKELSYFEKDE
jgi:hypothetical protein